MCTCFMALRVLLADESSTIKKVMQLALQDFGVEVKAVPIGLDVLQVARSFNPDIVFADVLLSKKNGYEVAAELKTDSTLRKTPIVLMWSGFMELDETKASACRAERRLEKPFDAETLRSLVKDLVPSLGGNAIAEYLSFPDMPEMVDETPPDAIVAEEPEIEMEMEPIAATPAAFDPFPALDEVEEIEEPEEFQSVPLPKNQGLPPPPVAKKAPVSEDWSRQDLSQFKIELPQEDFFAINEADLTASSIALSSGLEEISLDDIDNPEPKPLAPKSKPSSTHSRQNLSKTFAQSSSLVEENLTPLSALDPMRAEELLRQEARSVLESVAWKLLPEIVERVVREELQKLLKDAERL